MSKPVFYRQCALCQDRLRWQTSWIPEKFAVQDKVLRLKNAAGKWEDGWVVVLIGKTRLPENLLPNTHAEVKQHRRNTGDAMPKEKNG